MVLITTVTGSESFRSGTSNLRVYAVNSRAHPHCSTPPFPRTFLGKAASGVMQQARPRKLYASTAPTEALGVFWAVDYEVAEGMVLVIDATKSIVMSGGLRGSNSIPRRAMIGLRVRADAALRKITLQRIEDPTSATFDVMVQGRFDLLSYQQLLRLGADPSSGRMSEIPLYQPTRRNALLAHMEVSAELRAAPQRRVEQVVDTRTGRAVAVPVARRKRNVELD